jgi:hypothetical protein
VVKLEKGVRHGEPSYTQRMIERFDSARGRFYYSRRMGTVEPVFANIRATMGLDWFSLRGRRKVDTQWKLFSPGAQHRQDCPLWTTRERDMRAVVSEPDQDPAMRSNSILS